MFRKFIVSLLAAFAFVATGAFAAVDANKASQAELETVKGIGPGLSAKILKAREAGAFKDWADLVERVGGIGRGNAGRFSQAGLSVGGAAFDAAALPPAAPKAARSTTRKAAGKSAEDKAAARAARRAKKAEAAA